MLKEQSPLTLISSRKPSSLDSEVSYKMLGPPPPFFSGHLPSLLIWPPFDAQIWLNRTPQRGSLMTLSGASPNSLMLSIILSSVTSPTTIQNYLFPYLTSPTKLTTSSLGVLTLFSYLLFYPEHLDWF